MYIVREGAVVAGTRLSNMNNFFLPFCGQTKKNAKGERAKSMLKKQTQEVQNINH